MRLRLISAASGLLSIAFGAPAYGVTCYQVWNSQDALTYQSWMPPFELSSPAFDRAMTNLRARGGQLIFFESSICAITGNDPFAAPGQQRDPASLLVDVRAADPSAPRTGGMLSPTPAGGGAAPSTGTGGATSAPPAAPARGAPGRY